MIVFTTGFFASQFPAPENGEKLFDLVSLAKVHQFALPILLGVLEMFSVNLATGFWREPGLRRLVVAFVFLFMQGFPIAAAYIESRRNDKAQLVAAEQAVWTNDADKAAREQHDRELVLWQKSKDDYRGQIRDTAARLAKLEADATVERKIIEFPVSIAARDAAKARLDEINRSIAAEQKAKQGYENQLFALDAKLSAMPSLTTDGRKPTALPTDMDFIVQTAGQPAALASLAIVIVLFPGLLLGAGYYFASGEPAGDPSRAPVISLARELEQCARLQPAEQRLFAHSLVSVARAAMDGQKAVNETAEVLTSAHLAGQHAQDRASTSEALIREVRASRIAREAKAILVDFIDQSLRGVPDAA